MRLALAAAVLVLLAVPSTASAHATLQATDPADGAVLPHAPNSVELTFDDVVRVGSGNAAVANASGRSVLAGAPAAHGRTLTLRLRDRLPHGDYSVRWSIVSDDGHLERGVLAFAIGAGAPAPHSILGATVPLTWSDIVLRSLYYLGLLTAGGSIIFGLTVRRVLGAAALRPLARLVFFGLLAAFVGGSGIVHTAAPGTRYVLVVEAALGMSLAGGLAAALAPAYPRLLPVAAAVSLGLLVAPALAGHALDPNAPRLLAAPADVIHVVAAAGWLGALLGIAFVVRPVPVSPERSTQAVARASALAAAAVVVLAASGVARAFTELTAVSQAWSTSYGRVLLVKTGLFLVLLGAGLVNRRRLRRRSARRPRLVAFELLVLAAVVVVVAVLTELRPGRDYAASSGPATASPASRDRFASSPAASRKHGASSNAASPLGLTCDRRERDARRTVASAPAAPSTPPIANERSRPRRPSASMRRSYPCG